MSKVQQIKVISRPGGYEKKPEESEFSEDEFEIIGWPQLDDKALFGVAGEFVDLATENSEADPAAVLTETEYGITYPSMVKRGNLYGIQFHPEKSQQVGLGILANFAALVEAYRSSGSPGGEEEPPCS